MVCFCGVAAEEKDMTAALQLCVCVCLCVCRLSGCPCKRKENLDCLVPVQEDGCCFGHWIQTRAGSF